MLFSTIVLSLLPLAFAAPTPPAPTPPSLEGRAPAVPQGCTFWTRCEVTRDGQKTLLGDVPCIYSCGDKPDSRWWTHGQTDVNWVGVEGFRQAIYDACWWARKHGKISWDQAGVCWNASMVYAKHS